MRVEFVLNAKQMVTDVEPLKSVAEILKDMGLTDIGNGTLPGRYGLELIIFNGVLADASLIPGFRLAGAEVITVEGIKSRKDYPDYNRIVGEVLGGRQDLYCSNNIVMAVKTLFMERKNNDYAVAEKLFRDILCGELGFSQLIAGIKKLNYMKGKRVRG